MSAALHNFPPDPCHSFGFPDIYPSTAPSPKVYRFKTAGEDAHTSWLQSGAGAGGRVGGAFLSHLSIRAGHSGERPSADVQK